MTVRFAPADEAATLAAISAEAFEGNERWDAAAIVALLELPGAFALVSAGLDGMAVFRVAADEAELLTLAVRVASRRRGVGRALLQRGMSECGRLGAERLLLEVSEGNPGARGMYESCGFVSVGRRAGYYRDGCDAVVMGVGLR